MARWESYLEHWQHVGFKRIAGSHTGSEQAERSMQLNVILNQPLLLTSYFNQITVFLADCQILKHVPLFLGARSYKEGAW